MIPAGISAFPSSCGPARCGAGRGKGRTPGWRAKLARPPAPAPARHTSSTPSARPARAPVFSRAVVGGGELLPPLGQLLAQSAVPWRPSRPGAVEILLGLIDLLERQLADPVPDPAKPRGGFLTRLSRRAAPLLLLPAPIEHRAEERQRAVREVVGDELVQQLVNLGRPRAAGLDLVPAAI
ncbi:MAG: hypothetical protein ACR2ND_15420 [Solirubrobacteraceae bacterium]